MKIKKKNNSPASPNRRRPGNFLAAALSFVILFQLNIPAVYAEEALCPAQPENLLGPDTFSADGKMHLSADEATIKEHDISSFSGHVVIRQPESRIETDQATYDKKTEHVSAQGNVQFVSPAIRITGEAAHFDLKSEQATINKTEYQSLTSRMRGEAGTISIVNKDLVELDDATYTTCSPGNTDWLFSAGHLSLNKKTRQGTARNVVLRFKDVPFLYLPYIRFPLGNQRMSGLLFPTFGHSDEHGSELKIPYYWNIHPQLDATITPWYMSKRGTMLETEFRYLTEHNRGTLYSEYLDKDKLVDKRRERLRWVHESIPTPGWNTSAEYNYVADNNHLADFSNDLFNTSTTQLIQTGSVAYNSNNWLLNVRAEDYQTLSGTRPYRRLPQITFNTQFAEKNNTLNYKLDAEYVRFDHVDSSKVIGERLHIKPTISYPLRSAAGFVVPKLSVQQTSYNLQQTSSPTQLSRTVPGFSLDSGLFFEREGSLFSNDYIQTLEPQLFYLYVPYRDQSGFPVFDTSDYAFNFNSPFAESRFNSIDRIGDDNRLTAALATRFLQQKDGSEVFMARLGQVYYFSNRKVQLSAATPVDTAAYSNMIAEIKAQPGNWNFSSQLEWDPRSRASVTNSSGIGYHYNDRFSLNLAYRYQLDTLETREMNMHWKLNPRWQLNASHLYDMRDKHIVENLFAVNYESCCWGLKFSAKERFLTPSKTDKGVYIELVLKGLGGFGFQQ